MKRSKKILFSTLIALMLSCNCTVSDASTLRWFVNENGVKINLNLFNKLSSMGFTEREINYLTLEEVNKYDSFNVIALNYSSNKKISSNKVKYLSNSNNSYTERDDRKIETYVTWYNIESDTQNYIMAKTNFYWLYGPAERHYDVIGQYFGSDLLARFVYVDGGQKPEFTAKLSYVENYSYHYESDISEPKDESYTKTHVLTTDSSSCDETSAEYSIDSHILVRFDLPANENSETHGGDDYFHQYSYTRRNYTDFEFSLISYYVPKTRDTINTSIAGFYNHQIDGAMYDLSEVKLSTKSPYIYFDFSVFEHLWNKPEYDDEISSVTAVTRV